MATKADFTQEEWAQIRKSPIMASVAVVAASPSGPLGVIKEMLAMGRLIAETKLKSGSNPLVDSLVADIASPDGMEQAKPDELKGMSAAQARRHAVDALKAVAALVDRKAPGDAAGFKTWIQDVANRVANAAKEGGFLGIGGTRVSADEEAALRETAAALGVHAT
jgi:hypothetical protein